jgi:hypothetical protein
MKQIKFLATVVFLLCATKNACFSQYQVDDTLSFWSVTYIDWPPLQSSPQRQLDAVCEKAGAHCYIFVEENAQQPSQADMDSLVYKFDRHFYDSLTFRYGSVPDVFDHDSNIFILVLNEQNWSGYFDPGQQMSDSMVYARWNRHSNEREIIYLAANAFSSAEEIVSHEFGHLLHWQQDHSPEPLNNPVKFWEDAWVDEGFSTFAEEYLTGNLYQQNVLDYDAFFTFEPDIPLIYFSNYNQVKLFMMFMFEHFGKWNYISALISNQLNGISGIESTLDTLGFRESFDDAFEQWIIANYVDDPNYAGGKYSYLHYSFINPCFLDAAYHSFPTDLVSTTVHPYGADYISFTPAESESIAIDFNGLTNNKFRLDFIIINSATDQVDTIIGVVPNCCNHVSFITDGFGTPNYEVVMAVMCVDSTIAEDNTASYNYQASYYTGLEENDAQTNISVFPNPAKDNFYISTASDGNSILQLFDIRGGFIYSNNFAGNTTVDISNLAKGIYLLKITNCRGSYTKKIIKE